MLSIFDLCAILLTLSAVFGWLNHKFLPIPHTVGLLVMSVAASVVMIVVDLVFPRSHLFEVLTATLRQIDFSDVVMNVLLAFLLFAGSLHIDLGLLRHRALPVAMLALVGTVVSTAIVGVATWGAAAMIGFPLSIG